MNAEIATTAGQAIPDGRNFARTRVDRFVGVVWLRLISVPRGRLDMTMGRQDADAQQHHHGENNNTNPGHDEAVSRQPH